MTAFDNIPQEKFDDFASKIVNIEKKPRKFELIIDLPMLEKGAIFIESQDGNYILENPDIFDKKDYSFDKIEITSTVFFKEILEEKQKQTKEEQDFNLELFGNQIRDLTNDAIMGSRDLLRTYVLLKQIEKGVDYNLEKIKDEAFSEYIDKGLNDRDNIAYGFGASTVSKIQIQYEDDETYKNLKEKLKARETILKNAVEQNKKNNTVVDENGEVIQPPSYSFTSYLSLKKV